MNAEELSPETQELYSRAVESLGMSKRALLNAALEAYAPALRRILRHEAKKEKITTAGQPCRHCGTPVEWKQRDPDKPVRPGRSHFTAWLKCPKCRAIYMDESNRIPAA